MTVRRPSPKAGAAILATSIIGALLVIAFWTRSVSIQAALDPIEVQVVTARTIKRPEAAERSVDAYRGLGTWVDGFDFSPPYSSNGAPPLAPSAVGDMADFGVQTLFIQSGRLDDRSPKLLEDRWILTEFLMQAAQSDIDVVAWYLPKWTDDDEDLRHLLAAADFEVLGHRFDGIAVDIEWNQDGLETEERNRRFVELSRRLRAALPAEPIGAIVLPPVQTEVINPDFWPDFPWAQVAPLYDVWLPMSYWSFRTGPYGDGYTYNEESVRRLRSNIADPDALVHPIGGIGGQVDALAPGTDPYLAGVDQLARFADSLVDTNSIGGSIYDWLTLDDSGRAAMRNLFSSGVAATLGED